MKVQHGYLTRKSGAWLGHFSKWFESNDGTKTRVQKAFVIGSVSEMSKLEARLRLLCRLVYVGTQSLSKLASSVAAINSQMLAFIEGGATPDEASPAVDDFKDYLTPRHLEFWSYLGQRLYANQASCLAENKRREES